MRRTDGGWAAACDDGDEYAGESLHDAIRDAIGHERGESLLLQRNAYEALNAWVAQQASRIEREAGGG